MGYLVAQVTLVDHTTNPEETIGRFAAICYDSDTSSSSCVRRAASCVNKGHLATLRFAYATFLIEGISRAGSHQLVRSKHLDYLQQSQRYVNQTNATFVYPQLDSRSEAILARHYDSCIRVYDALIARGIKKEDARFVLPAATTTSLYATGNFQAWKDFIKLRATKEAQWEIRDIAYEVSNQLHRLAPNLFKDLND